MRIQYASDLHLEFADNWRFLKAHPIEPVGDILVLAGDIGYLGDDNYVSHPFWDIVADNFKEVFVVPGNHEFYKYYDISTLPDGKILSVRPNVNVYYNGVINFEGVELILSTLWARISLQDAFMTESGVTDFHRILFDGETLTFELFNKEHERCMDFLRGVVKQSTAGKRIIVTHHLPSFQLSSPDFKGSR
ncbi:MAG: metallophosphoesterase, partial [Treponema sp.]|nr:metallophosphoesterase [Treponema sp.]